MEYNTLKWNNKWRGTYPNFHMSMQWEWNDERHVVEDRDQESLKCISRSIWEQAYVALEDRIFTNKYVEQMKYFDGWIQGTKELLVGYSKRGIMFQFTIRIKK